MHYYLYRITNIANGKIYIGVHETPDLDDGYMGSGQHLVLAMRKNPQDFRKDILEYFTDSESMYAREAEIVDWDFIQRDDTYNIRLGGKGGWGHLRGMVTVKTAFGKILKVSKMDPRFISGELVGNTKGLRYFNDGVRTYRLRNDQQPEGHWLHGRAWSASGRRWYNDGAKSFYIAPEEAVGLIEGRIDRTGMKWFTNGVEEVQRRECPQGFISGRLSRSSKSTKVGCPPTSGSVHSPL